MNDEILDRIFAIRERIAEECGHDFKKLGERYKRLQENCRPELLVTAKVPRTDPESLLPPGDLRLMKMNSRMRSFARYMRRDARSWKTAATT